jgi:hypothetical protein
MMAPFSAPSGKVVSTTTHILSASYFRNIRVGHSHDQL